VLAVLVLVALGLAAVLVPMYTDLREFQTAADCFTSQADIEAAAGEYAAQAGTLPTTIAEMVPAYLASVPRCPSGGSYLWLTRSDCLIECSVHGPYAVEYTQSGGT
jgi:hypothetical protein